MVKPINEFINKRLRMIGKCGNQDILKLLDLFQKTEIQTFAVFYIKGILEHG